MNEKEEFQTLIGRLKTIEIQEGSFSIIACFKLL